MSSYDFVNMSHSSGGVLSQKMARRGSRSANRSPSIQRLLLRQALTSSLDELLDTSSALQAICHNTEDHREAVQAFLEKRKPNPFKGR